MDNCSPEIHAIIFSYACNDDGKTGVALSSVSHYIREVSAPYQWQSVAIPGVRQGMLFAQRLEQVDDPLSRPIRHLLLTDYRSCTVSGFGPMWSETGPWGAVQNAILRYAAPTLETLTCFLLHSFHRSAFHVASLLRIDLPVLRELTISAHCTPHQLQCVLRGLIAESGMALWDKMPSDDLIVDFNTRNADSMTVDPKLSDYALARPKLRRLYFACRYNAFEYGTEATRYIMRFIAPDVIQLRIGVLDRDLERVREVLFGDLLAQIEASSPTLPVSPRILPYSIDSIRVGTSRTGFPDCCNAPVELKRKFEYGEFMADWLDRLEGGVGCWDKRPNSQEQLEQVAKMAKAAEDHQQELQHMIISMNMDAQRESTIQRLVKKVKFW